MSVLMPDLPFADYLQQVRSQIKTRRLYFSKPETAYLNEIVEANSPFEFMPQQPQLNQDKKIKYGLLMVHGLFDSPYTFRDLAHYFADHGLLCRTILLPGHGTHPEDLLTVQSEDWLKTFNYGLASLKHQVEKIFVIGYSTGGALALYQALLDARDISGLLLIAPALQIKTPWAHLLKYPGVRQWFSKYWPWLIKKEEINPNKYQSIPLHPVAEVAALSRNIAHLAQSKAFSLPLFITATYQDQTISTTAALKFFTACPNPGNQFLLYNSNKLLFSDPRIFVRNSYDKKSHIEHYSHIALPFSASNSYYGQHSRLQSSPLFNIENCFYGSYHPLYLLYLKQLHRLKLSRNCYQELTYNPDFQFMAHAMLKFILT